MVKGTAISTIEDSSGTFIILGWAGQVTIVCVRVHVCVYVVCVCVCLYVCVCMCVYVVCVYMHACACVCINVYAAIFCSSYNLSLIWKLIVTT